MYVAFGVRDVNGFSHISFFYFILEVDGCAYISPECLLRGGKKAPAYTEIYL